ncbi:hypothetical protein [Hugenholtzia roseola]|nr:hypothetical protein [Hugenholtzia roseola]
MAKRKMSSAARSAAASRMKKVNKIADQLQKDDKSLSRSQALKKAFKKM